MLGRRTGRRHEPHGDTAGVRVALAPHNQADPAPCSSDRTRQHMDREVHALHASLLRKALLAMLGLTVVIVGFISSYTSALGKPTAHDVPIAVTAPATLREQLNASPQLKVHPVPDLAAAAEMVDDRAAYGALVFPPTGPVTVVVATGGGHAVADLLTKLGQERARLRGTTLRAVDVAPPSRNDPNGSVEFYCVAFLFLGGALGASVLGRILATVCRPRDVLETLGLVLLYSALLSVAVTFFTDIVYGTLAGHFGAEFLALWLYVATVCLAVTGVTARAGSRASIALILLLVVFGNPSSGGPVPRPLLNGFYSGLNPLLPQGAALSTLRGIQYFHDHNISTGLLCLAIWSAAGVALLGAALLPWPRLHSATRL
jgi:hypothetical protein